MARSDPPFDAADETTTQPVGQQRELDERHEPPPQDGHRSAASEALPNANWFDPDFDAEELGMQPAAPNPPPPQHPPVSAAAPDAPHQATPAPEPALAEAVEADSEQTAPTVPLDRNIEQSAEPRTTMPLEPPPTSETRTLESFTAEIAAALAAPKAIDLEPTPRWDIVPAHAPPPVGASQPISPTAQTLASTDRPQSRIGGLVDRAGKVIGIIVGAWFCVVFVLIVLYRFINPPFSTLMAAQWLSGTSVHRQWVPLESISPNLIHAVIVSEDGRFCDHWGIDFVEIAEALKRTPRGVPRGASTITMQVAKNLFLWPAKSYLRKIIEVPLTYVIELFWPKRRILEVYLNIAEWGPGIFGAEAASEAHFSHSASRLNAREAAQLAVVLPNPIVRDAGSPGTRTAHRASVIQRRTGREPEAIACILGAE